MELLALLYQWIKAAHLIFVIFWMAGLFMMPRFFVYHQESAAGSDESARWIDHEARLRKIILNPSMIIVWLLGITLIAVSYQNNRPILQEGWLHVKLLLVLLLSGYHGWMVGYSRKLARDERPLSGKQLRLLNEVPGVAAALIVVFAIVQPF